MVQSQAGSLRGLKALVAFLGILVVLGTAVVAGVVIKRLLSPSATAAAFSAAVPPGSAGLASSDAAVSLPAGSRILGLASAGGSFAIWTSGPSGGQIYLLDPVTGGLRLAVKAPQQNASAN